MKSLITKLNGVAQNNELLKMDECLVHFKVLNSPTSLEIQSGLKFSVDNVAYTSGSTVSVGGHFLKISPKSSLKYIRFSDDNLIVDLSSLKGTGNMLSLKEILQTDISTYHKGACYKGNLLDLIDFSNLEKLEFEGCNGMQGSTRDLINFPKLKVFYGTGTSIDFTDISPLLQLKSLEDLRLGGKGVNIEPLAALVNLKNLICNNVPFSGSIENLAQGMLDKGRTAGTLSVNCSYSDVTYKGNKSSKLVTYTITFSDNSYSVSES